MKDRITSMGSSFGLDLSTVSDVTQSVSSNPSGGIPPQMQEAETAIVDMLPASAQKYVQQGELLVNGAEAASKGDYSGLIAAATAIVNDFPPGIVRQTVDSVLTVADDAAKGEEIGSIIPVYGQVIGAVIGAVIGIITDIFSSSPPVIQSDMRSTGLQKVFPAVPKGTPYSVVPGAPNRNPRDENDSIFYTLDGVPTSTVSGPVSNANIAQDFNFGVTYIKPPHSTAESQYQAWLLAQIYLGTDSVSLKHSNGGDFTKVELARNILGTMLGGPTYVAALVKRVEQWYGSRKGWATNFPSLSTYPQNQISNPHPLNPAANFQPPRMQFWQAHMLDWLYFPQYVSYNDNTSTFGPTNIQNATDVYLCVDPSLLMLCEGAVLGHKDLVMLHLFMGKSWILHRFVMQDNIVTPGVDIRKHRNFMRIIGILSERVRNTARKNKRLSHESNRNQKRNPLQIGARGATIESSTSSVNGDPMSFSMSPDHIKWSEGALSLIRKSKGIPDFGADPSMVDNGDGTGTFHNSPANTPVVPYDSGPPLTDPTLDAATGGALAGTVFGPVGTLLGGAAGIIAQKAYDMYQSGQPGEIVQQTHPINPDPNAPNEPTPEQAAHTLGGALAAGEAKQNLGLASKPDASLTTNQKAAHTVVQGLSSKGNVPTAPDTVKTAVLKQLPADALPGVQAGVASLGGNSFLLGVLAVGAAMGGYALYEKSRKEQGVKHGF